MPVGRRPWFVARPLLGGRRARPDGRRGALRRSEGTPRRAALCAALRRRRRARMFAPARCRVLAGGGRDSAGGILRPTARAAAPAQDTGYAPVGGRAPCRGRAPAGQQAFPPFVFFGGRSFLFCPLVAFRGFPWPPPAAASRGPAATAGRYRWPNNRFPPMSIYWIFIVYSIGYSIVYLVFFYWLFLFLIKKRHLFDLLF